MKLQLHSSFASNNNPTQASSEDESSSSSSPSLARSSSTAANNIDWWSHNARHACRYYNQQRQEQLDQAHKVADVIGKRNFENRISTTGTHNGILPYGAGYGFLIGGAALVAVSIPAMMLSRPLSHLVGRHAARVSMRIVSVVAAGTVATRYVSRYQTLEDLKVIGTYLSPTEASPSADAISQHPIIQEAIKKRHQQQQQQVQHDGGSLPHQSIMLDSWKSSKSANHNHWWRPSMEHQILTEYENVLVHCEERSLVLAASHEKSQVVGGHQMVRKNKRSW